MRASVKMCAVIYRGIDLDLNFKGQTIKTLMCPWPTLSRSQIWIANIWKFQRSNVSNLNISEMVRASIKMCAETWPLATDLWHKHRYWGIGIPGYTFGYVIQAWAIPPPSWGSAPRWLQVANRISKRRPHLQLYRKGAYFHYLWLYFQITAKRFDIWRNLFLWMRNLFT